MNMTVVVVLVLLFYKRWVVRAMVVIVALVTLLVVLALRMGSDHADRVWIHKSRGTEHQQRVCSCRIDGVAVASRWVMIGRTPSGWL